MPSVRYETEDPDEDDPRDPLAAGLAPTVAAMLDEHRHRMGRWPVERGEILEAARKQEALVAEGVYSPETPEMRKLRRRKPIGLRPDKPLVAESVAPRPDRHRVPDETGRKHRFVAKPRAGSVGRFRFAIYQQKTGRCGAR